MECIWFSETLVKFSVCNWLHIYIIRIVYGLLNSLLSWAAQCLIILANFRGIFSHGANFAVPTAYKMCIWRVFFFFFKLGTQAFSELFPWPHMPTWKFWKLFVYSTEGWVEVPEQPWNHYDVKFSVLYMLFLCFFFLLFCNIFILKIANFPVTCTIYCVNEV